MSKLDRFKEGFGILTNPTKDTEKVKEEVKKPKQPTIMKEDNVDAQVSKFFQENSKDILNVSEPRTRTTMDGRNNRVNNGKRVRIYEPSKFNDVKAIGEEIKSGKIVVVNFKNLDEDESVRVENFLYGMCFYADIEPEPVHDGIICIDPQHTKNEK